MTAQTKRRPLRRRDAKPESYARGLEYEKYLGLPSRGCVGVDQLRTLIAGTLDWAQELGVDPHEAELLRRKIFRDYWDADVSELVEEGKSLNGPGALFLWLDALGELTGVPFFDSREEAT